MLSVEQINKMEQDIETYKQELQEAQEIIAELKHKNKVQKEEILKFKWDNPYFDLYNNVVSQRDTWEEKSKQYKSCLQEIKEIANRAFVPGAIISIDDIRNDYHQILQLIDKSEEE